MQFFLKWVIPGLFFFIFVFSIQLTENNVQYKFCPLTGFESQTSGVGSNRSTNCLTTTEILCHHNFLIFTKLAFVLFIFSIQLNQQKKAECKCCGHLGFEPGAAHMNPLDQVWCYPPTIATIVIPSFYYQDVSNQPKCDRVRKSSSKSSQDGVTKQTFKNLNQFVCRGRERRTLRLSCTPYRTYPIKRCISENYKFVVLIQMLIQIFT